MLISQILWYLLIHFHDSVGILLVFIVFRIVLNTLKIVDYIPVIGFLNKLGGAAVSFFISFIIIYVICSAVFSYVPQEALDSVGLTKQAIKGSILLSAFI